MDESTVNPAESTMHPEEDARASKDSAVRVSPVELALDEATGSSPLATMDLLLDMRLRLSVQLGRTQLSIREVLALSPGSVVELDKTANEPVDILVNGRLVAHGEVVVVDENFGVRVLDIVSPSARIGTEAIS